MEGPLCPSLMEIQSSLALWVMPAAKPPNGLLCACRVGGSRDLRWKLELGVGIH